jgi:hypothetical protein
MHHHQVSTVMVTDPQSAASTGQPNSQKSWTQQAGDMMSGNQNENQESLMDKAKNALGGNNNNQA